MSDQTGAEGRVSKVRQYCDFCGDPITDPKLANVEWNNDSPEDLIILHKACSYGYSACYGKPHRWRTLKESKREKYIRGLCRW